MESSRYYYEAPAEAFVANTREDDGGYTVKMRGCTIYGALSVITSRDSIVLELDRPMADCYECGLPECGMVEITKEIEDNGQT
jgi:hypothetical protein